MTITTVAQIAAPSAVRARNFAERAGHGRGDERHAGQEAADDEEGRAPAPEPVGAARDASVRRERKAAQAAEQRRPESAAGGEPDGVADQRAGHHRRDEHGEGGHFPARRAGDQHRRRQGNRNRELVQQRIDEDDDNAEAIEEIVQARHAATLLESARESPSPHERNQLGALLQNLDEVVGDLRVELHARDVPGPIDRDLGDAEIVRHGEAGKHRQALEQLAYTLVERRLGALPGGLGQALGSGFHISKLRRSPVARMSVAECVVTNEIRGAAGGNALAMAVNRR